MDDYAFTQDSARAMLSPRDGRVRLETYCKKHGISCEWVPVTTEDNVAIRIDIPNGRTSRSIIFSKEQAKECMRSSLKDAKALGYYDAFQFADSGVIEASVTPLGDRGGWRYTLTHLEGSERDEDSYRWRLGFISDNNLVMEIGDASSRFAAMSPGVHMSITTVRISGVKAERHDEAIGVLERVVSSALFELELNYGVALSLRRIDTTSELREARPRRISAQPCAPKNEYSRDALQLYWYARSATGMPLLQFLANYQVLEYYFPLYSQREVVERLRYELKDPTLDYEDDRRVLRILRLASGQGRGYGSEREQLKATIRGCATEDDIRDFLSESPERVAHFGGKSKIDGLARIDPNNRQISLLDQAATRIYDLRCRIVHTKEDGVDGSPDILLPFGIEAQSIGHDIGLVRYLAQRALISSAVRLQIP
ncbi:hypothetical protein GCM10010149_42250 [Nonomuraea roseoviolacea subsp. roseoviolacea]